ncbi:MULTISPECIES: sugar ABC transporter substrate-binding protein [unclassified Paenibacillus]|uniref:ABC transporter substrate-binding protein n=1 Tax=Paenibacillus TaxID=44249 RepID=UPI001576CC78|nr:MULTISPECIES: sugar ABC transporter substrate-binding protein [unclassified Paenibacillus]NTZ16740.1 sugar ABC transporter substrate-binding protein [Paenibacillus sp. JMULE4]
MWKKIRLAAIVSVLGLTTACNPGSTGDGSTAPSGTTAPNGQTNKPGETVKITWWDYMSSDEMVEALTKVIDDYQKANPHVKIERTYVPFGDLKNKLLLGSAAGQLPDIVWIDNPDHQAFAAAGVLADITAEVKEWGQADQYFDGPWSSTVYKDKNYGVPNSSNNLALYYNVDMLEQAGVKPPADWNELLDAAKKLTKQGVYGMSVSAVRTEQGTFQFLPFVWQSGSDVTQFNSPGTVEAIKLWKELLDSGAMSKEILGQDQQASMLQFAAGNTAMMVNGTWQIPVLKKEAKFQWDIVPLPVNKQGGTILGGENWAITSTSKHKDIAWDIVKFANQGEYLKNFLKAAGRLPSRRDFIQDPYWQGDRYFKIFADGMNVAKARAYGPNYPKISDAIQEMIQQVLTGVKSPEDAVKETDAKIKPLLQ